MSRLLALLACGILPLAAAEGGRGGAKGPFVVDASVPAAPAPAPAAASDDVDAPPPRAPAPAATDPATAQRVAALEDELGRISRGMHRGDGPYRDGPLLTVDGGASLLDRLRDREKELATARADDKAKDERIAQLERELAATEQRANRLAEQADGLAQAHDQLTSAQQEVADRAATIAKLKQQVDAAALARLQAERLYFVLAGAVMKLQPGQTQDLLDLQQQVRGQAREFDAHATEQP